MAEDEWQTIIRQEKYHNERENLILPHGEYQIKENVLIFLTSSFLICLPLKLLRISRDFCPMEGGVANIVWEQWKWRIGGVFVAVVVFSQIGVKTVKVKMSVPFNTLLFFFLCLQLGEIEGHPGTCGVFPVSFVRVLPE